MLDTDQMIEIEAGMSISGIFATQGEPAFRRAETRVLEKLLAETDRSVISVGGGLPLLEQNRVILRQLGTVVFLRVQPETVLALSLIHIYEYGYDVRHDDGHVPYVRMLEKSDIVCMDCE